MSNEKMENLLNLALDATEREREKSLDLDTGYDRAERTWEVIVKFGGTEEALRGLFAEKFPEEYDRIRIICDSAFARAYCGTGGGTDRDRIHGETETFVFCSE